MIRFLKRSRPDEQVKSLSRDIDQTFSRVSKDIDTIRDWINHLDTKGNMIHKAHKNHVGVTHKELKNVMGWINYLKDDMKQLKQFMKESIRYTIETHKSHKEIYRRLAELEKQQGQLRTLEDKSKDNEKDTKGHERDTKKDTEKPKEKQDLPYVKVVKKGGLKDSQKELLMLLYEQEEALDYKTIAKLLKKKEKSIRNLIYELREEGIDIRDSHIGFRKKGFYLTEEEKLKISGR